MSALNCALPSGGRNYLRTRSSAASVQKSIPAYSGSSPAPAGLLHAAAAPHAAVCGAFGNCFRFIGICVRFTVPDHKENAFPASAPPASEKSFSAACRRLVSTYASAPFFSYCTTFPVINRDFRVRQQHRFATPF